MVFAFRNCSVILGFWGRIINTFTLPIKLSWIPIFASGIQYNYPTYTREDEDTRYWTILWAAPKKKTSYSKKRMRQATKKLKDLHNLNECPGCGRKKLAHTLCLFCFQEIKEFIKSQYK